MDPLNRIRLAAGIPMDLDLERKTGAEAEAKAKAKALAEKQKTELTVESATAYLEDFKNDDNARQIVAEMFGFNFNTEEEEGVERDSSSSEFTPELEDDPESNSEADPDRLNIHVTQIVNGQEAKGIVIEADDSETEVTIEFDTDDDLVNITAIWDIDERGEQVEIPLESVNIEQIEEELMTMYAEHNAESRQVQADDRHDQMRDDKMTQSMGEGIQSYGPRDDKDFEKHPAKPFNVSNGKKNKDQVYDALDPKNTKDESPTQLRALGDKSEHEKGGSDLENDFKVPASIISALDSKAKEARREARTMNVYNTESANFYKELAQAFEDLKTHLSKGTRYDFKLAQNYAQTLMGSILHKIPANVWKFLVNGGETASLKSYYKDISNEYPKRDPNLLQNK